MERKKTIWICALLMTAVLIAGFTLTDMAFAKKKPVQIALITYRTGVAKDWGDSSLLGFQFAIRQFNKKGGIIGGRKIEYKVYDEGYSVEVGVASTKKAIAQGAKGIVGFQDATTAVPGVLICKEEGIPVVTLTASSHRIIDEGFHGSFVSGCPPGGKPGSMMEGIALWAQNNGFKRAAQLAWESEFCHVNDRLFKEAWGQSDSPTKYLGPTYVPYGKGDATLELTKVVATNPDFIFGCVWGHDIIVSTMTKLHELGYKGTLFINYVSLQQGHVDEAGEAAEGVLSADQWHYDPTVPANVEFRNAFVEEMGVEPDTLSEWAYEVTYAMLLAMDRAGTDTDLKKIADAWHAIDDWMTPRGELLKVMPSGQHYMPWYPLLKVVDGKITVAGKVPLMDPNAK